MTQPIWGLLGPETLGSERRTRTLGLGASVRMFNERAVPGIGGVWFGKQVMLATLGVAVAEEARAAGAKVQNIETANAIEALACWLAFDDKKRRIRDERLRGNNKLQGKDLSQFKQVRRRNFYVTQPMRMSTVQALPALGLVEAESSRFNGFKCSQAGREFVTAACSGFSPYRRTVMNYLAKWVREETEKIESPELRNALSPITAMPEFSRNILKEQLLKGNLRRSKALKWVEVLRQNTMPAVEWDSKPSQIDDDHWHDLRSGALFFETRDAAISVLDALEAHIGKGGNGQRFNLEDPVPEVVDNQIKELHSAAQKFLTAGHKDKEANQFCVECTKPDALSVLKSLVHRDGTVLRMLDKAVLPGPAFRSSAQPAEEVRDTSDSPTAVNSMPLPDGISFRMRNLYLLNLDMHNELDAWLNSTPGDTP